MPRGRQDATPQCQVIPDKYRVSKEKIDEYDLPGVIKALDGVKGRAHNIGLALRMKPATVEDITKIHGRATDRCAISIMDTWLRGNYMNTGQPYTLHEEQYQCPSWWNLVWAVARDAGGHNPAHAEKIAQEYIGYSKSEDTSAFSNASSKPFGDETTANELTDELKDVQHRWYEIGVALRIPTHELDAISKNPAEDSFQKMIQRWLELGKQQKSEKPCWKLLLIAVAASYGGQNPGFAQYLLRSHTGISGDDDAAESHPKKKPKITDDGLSDWLPVKKPKQEPKQEIKDLFLPYVINKKKEEKHGLALIIVNETFTHHPDHPDGKILSKRDCADHDFGRLNKLWTSLGYRVRVERDKTAEQIKSLFDNIRAEGDAENTIQEGDDSFVCCISSHGTWDPALGTDVVYGVEGTRVEENDQITVKGAVDIKALAYDRLSPLQHGCPKLKGRPKMFFTQACRGVSHGRIADDGTMGTGKVHVFAPPKRIPRETDFLFAYATAPGNKAYNNPPYGEPDRPLGSFFITYLCQYLEEYAHKLPLVPILEAVSQQQTALEVPYDVPSHNHQVVTTRQSPNFSSSLRGPVFFFNDACERYKKGMLFDL